MTTPDAVWLRPDTSLLVGSDGTVLRRTAEEASVIRSAPLAALVSSHGGRLAGPFRLGSAADPQKALWPRLVQAGVAVLAPDTARPEHVGLAHSAGVGVDDFAPACELLATAPEVGVTPTEPVPRQLTETLRSAGLDVRRGTAGADVVLLLCEDLLEDGVEEELTRWWAEGRPVVVASATERFVTPVLEPRRSPCPHCLLATVRANSPATTLFPGRSAVSSAPQLSSPFDLAQLALLVARTVVGHRLSPLTGDDACVTRARVWTASGTVDSVTVPSGVACAQCSPATVEPQDSVHPVLGLVRSVRSTALPGGVWIARAEHALTTRAIEHGSAAGAALHAYRAFSEGKGMSRDQAEANAVGEVVERVCGVFRGGGRVTYGRCEDLPEAVDPQDLLLFSPQQYRLRKKTNAGCSSHNRVPAPPVPSRALPWVAAEPLDGGGGCLLPYAYVYEEADHDLGVPLHERFLRADSNGCATAPSRREALLRGLLELVERDAVAIWWYNRLRQPPMAPSVRSDPVVQRVADAMTATGRGLEVLDLTHDLGVPVCAAVAPLLSPGPTGSDEVAVGFGAGLTAPEAARRACMEAAQFLPMLDSLRGDERRFDRHGPDSRRWWSRVRTAEHPWLLPDEEAPRVRSGELSGLPGLVAAVAASGTRVFYVDQSQARFSSSTVRVVAPGLRHFWRRTAPGRLYSVPVTVGRLSTPRTEEELNPYNVYF